MNSRTVRNIIIFSMAIVFVSMFYAIKFDSGAYKILIDGQRRIFGKNLPEKVVKEINKEIAGYNYGYMRSLTKSGFLLSSDGTIALKLNPDFKEIECHGIALRVKQILNTHKIHASVGMGRGPLMVFDTHYFITIGGSKYIFDATPPYNQPGYERLSGNYTISSEYSGPAYWDNAGSILNMKSIDLSNNFIPVSFRSRDGYKLISTMGIRESNDPLDTSRDVLYMLTIIPEKIDFPLKYHRIELVFPVVAQADEMPPERRLEAYQATLNKSNKSPLVISIDNSAAMPYMKYVERDLIDTFYKNLVRFIRVTKTIA